MFHNTFLHTFPPNPKKNTHKDIFPNGLVFNPNQDLLANLIRSNLEGVGDQHPQLQEVDRISDANSKSRLAKMNAPLSNSKLPGATPYLEDHPRTCKWLVTMVIVFVP